MSIARIGPDGLPVRPPPKTREEFREEFMDRVSVGRGRGYYPNDIERDLLVVYSADEKIPLRDRKRAMDLLAPNMKNTPDGINMFTQSPSLNFYAAYVHPHWKSSLFFGAIFLIILLIF